MNEGSGGNWKQAIEFTVSPLETFQLTTEIKDFVSSSVVNTETYVKYGSFHPF